MHILKFKGHLIGVFYTSLCLSTHLSFACFEGVFKASNAQFYHFFSLGTLGSKMSKNQLKAIEMSRHATALSSFQPMG